MQEDVNKFYLCVFRRDAEPPYDTLGMQVLQDVEKAVITYRLNAASTLEFDYPLTHDSGDCLKVGNIVAYMGKPFRIKRLIQTHAPNAVPKVNVLCYDFMQELSDYVIPDFFMIGKTPREMLTEALKNTPFHVLKPDELPEGMEWWDVPTDLELNRTTPAQVLEQVISLTGGGEVYLKDYDIALVKAVGRKAKMPIRLGVNLQNIERAIDGKSIITRVYPVGQDDLHIDYVTEGSQQYIDSKWQEVFGVIEGYAEYSDIAALGEDDPDSFDGASTLYWTACANMDAPIHCGNSNLRTDKNKYVNTTGMQRKLDIPAIEYKIGMRDLAFLENRPEFQYDVGDVIQVIDEAFGIDTGNPGEKDYLNLTQQVIEKEISLTDPLDNKLVLGQHKSTLLAAIYEGKTANDYIGNHTDKDKDIKEDSTEGTERTETLTITPPSWAESTLRITDRFGVRSMGQVYYDDYRNPTAAVAISKSVLAMGRKVNGAWQWNNVIANGAGNLDARMWVGSLSTTLVDIMSDSGKLAIQDNLIIMKDKANKTRLKMGYDGKQYTFELYDTSGAKTAYLDENGTLCLAGKLFASHVIGVSKEEYEAFPAEESQKVPGVFAQIDPNGIKVMQDSDGVRLQKMGMTVNQSGNPILVIGAGNGYNKMTFNGVTYSDDCFVIEKSPTAVTLQLMGTGSVIQFTPEAVKLGDIDDVAGEIERLTIENNNLKRRIEALENKTESGI